MALPPQISVWDLWSESARLAESLGDPMFLECMEAANTNKIFDDLTDDQLKTTLSIINSMLNDPKSKPKGLTLFNDFVSQINPSRLIGFQDAVISSLHLVVKGLDSALASRALSNFLTKCHHMSEVNQVVTSAIVPKILSYFVEECQGSVSQRSPEEIALLKVCLTEYHGPCGHFRDKLEKILVPLLDTENNDLIQQLSEVIPLLSYAGGGGPAGDKHTKDWTAMINKFLMTTYFTLHQLYGDNLNQILEQVNVFDGEQLTNLKRIVESQVLLRLSLLKRRLQNLLTVISGYLRFPFPAPKFIPQKTILELIVRLIAVLPPNITRSVNETSQLKEQVFLSAMIPGVHVMALNLLRGLILSVGSNIFTCATMVERILDSEFKWLLYKPRAFEKLKYELYNTLTDWLTLTGGSVTNLKTLSMWVNAIGVDTRVEKEVVELKMSKPSPGKSVKLMSTASMTLSAGRDTQVFVEKNAELSQAALSTLALLIPVLDADNHRKIYEHLVKTAAIISQFQNPPSPYKNPECRKLIYQNLSRLCKSPQPKSPVSVALAVTLLRSGTRDPTRLVSAYCANQLFELERLLHPISATLSLAGPSPHPVALDNSNAKHFTSCDIEMEELPEEDQHQNNTSQNNFPVDPNYKNICLTACVQAVSAALSQEMLFGYLKEKAEIIMRDGFTQNSIPSNLRDVQNGQSSLERTPGEGSSSMLNSNVQSSLNASINLQNDLQSDDDHEIVQLGSSNDNDESVVVEPEPIPRVNGNSYHMEDGLHTQEDEMEENLVRSNGTPRDMNEMEIVENSSKPSSPLKSAPVQPVETVDGPTVEDMLSSFVDVEPVG